MGTAENKTSTGEKEDLTFSRILGDTDFHRISVDVILGRNEEGESIGTEEERIIYNKLLFIHPPLGKEEREIYIKKIGSGWYGYLLLEDIVLTKNERERILISLEVRYLYEALANIKKLSLSERTLGINTLILKADGEIAYKTLISISGINELSKRQLLNKLGAKYSLEALINIGNLSINDREILYKLLIADITPEYAYKALEKVQGLTREQRTNLMRNLGDFSRAALSLDTLTGDEKKFITNIFSLL